jgi:hypothetical protein
MWGWMLWETISQELRYAGRTVRKSPAFAATAILTLALGIGASTAVFTVVDSVLLKPLGFHESGRLVACWERVRFLRDDATGPNPRHVEVWRQRHRLQQSDLPAACRYGTGVGRRTSAPHQRSCHHSEFL